MDAVGLKQLGGLGNIGHVFEKEGHEARFFGGSYFAKSFGKLFAIVCAKVGRQLHAYQQHFGTHLLRSVGHAAQVVCGHGHGQAAQCVVCAQLDHYMRGLVLRQQRGQARAAARGGVAADAGVDHFGGYLFS